MAVDADAHALQGNGAGRDGFVQTDEAGIAEQIAVVIELADLEHDIAQGQADEVRDVEQQSYNFV